MIGKTLSALFQRNITLFFLKKYKFFVFVPLLTPYCFNRRVMAFFAGDRFSNAFFYLLHQGFIC